MLNRSFFLAALIGMSACGKVETQADTLDVRNSVRITCGIYKFSYSENPLSLTAEVRNNTELVNIKIVERVENAVVIDRKNILFNASYRPRTARRADFNRFELGSSDSKGWDLWNFSLYLPKNVTSIKGKFTGELEGQASDGGTYSNAYCFAE